MKHTILLLALFPFLHSTTYSVDYVSCKVDEIVVKHEDETIQIALFNTKIIDEKGWKVTCDMIQEAKKLRIEIDPSSKIEEVLPVYLFADNKLVQEELMKKSYAYPMIKNPEYTYEKRLEDALDITPTIASSKQGEQHLGYPIVAPLFLTVVILLWLCMVIYLYFKRKKQHIKTNVKKESI